MHHSYATMKSQGLGANGRRSRSEFPPAPVSSAPCRGAMEITWEGVPSRQHTGSIRDNTVQPCPLTQCPVNVNSPEASCSPCPATQSSVKSLRWLLRVSRIESPPEHEGDKTFSCPVRPGAADRTLHPVCVPGQQDTWTWRRIIS